MKVVITLLLGVTMLSSILRAQSNEPYTIELERINMPGTPSIHSFAFAESNGKWLFIGGRTNGLHGFNPGDAFPKQYANKNIFVVNPNTIQTWSKNIFADLPYSTADPLRSNNMQYFQDGNKLYLVGGYGFDSLTNGFITFPTLTVFDVEETIQAIISGSSISPFVKQISDNRLQVCGGEFHKLCEKFFLIGGHNFTGSYTRLINNQVYSNQIRKFQIVENGSSVEISNYDAITDTVEFHRRDMNVVPAIRTDGITPYMILYGGVFLHGSDLPYLNPLYIDGSSVIVDNSFSQKMSQYTCSYLSSYDAVSGNMHTTFFGGMSLYYYNEITQQQECDSLVPFINDITTLTKYANGSSDEKISPTKLPALLGTNSKFILNEDVHHFENDVIKINELTGRTFVGHIFGGIRALLPNNTPSFPSEYIFKVYLTPKSVAINPIGNFVPNKFSLLQNFPNPFNPSTRIKFDVPRTQTANSTNIKLTVYDAVGKLAEVLINTALSPGSYEVTWDGSRYSNGIYFYKLETGAFTDTKRMILLK